MSYNDTIVAEAGPSSQTITLAEASFVRQFKQYGGTLSSKCKFAHYEAMGTGLIAAEVIEEGESLFSIPRHMLLNLKNSRLPDICMQYEKDRVLGSTSLKWEDVNTGWCGLMLTLMWEQFRSSAIGRESLCALLGLYSNGAGEEDTSMDVLDADGTLNNDEASPDIGRHSRESDMEKGKHDWGYYLDILPKSFDIPMFWSEEDLLELEGTSIPGKIGKEEASKDYIEKVRPYVLARSEIFFGTLIKGEAIEKLIEDYYSMDCFHMMGSRILSRSFHVKDAVEGILGEEGKEYDGKETGSDIDSDSSSEEDEGEGDEDINTVSMVPMADMLNARCGCDNAHLFYMPNQLEMRATQRIPAGTQIMNTYGDPPSSDLLRRYGYVDLGNAADIVEISVSELIQACIDLEKVTLDGNRQKSLLERIAWSCSLGLDEVFALTYPFPPSDQAPHHPVPSEPSSKELKEAAMTIPEELLIQARLLCLSQEAYEKAKMKEKLPNPKIDAVEEHDTGIKRMFGVAELINQAIEAKKAAYATSLKEDEELLYGDHSKRLSINKRNAIVVRLSEKRILNETQKVLQAAMAYVETKRKDTSQQNGTHIHKRKKV